MQPLWIALSRTDFLEVALLRNYNTAQVVMGVTMLGISAGMIGSFLLLRKRSLLSDTLSHACLPGIVLTYILLTLSGREGKSVPLLLMGATVSGLLGVGIVVAIRNSSRIRDDAAMGIVLSVFFGLGVALLSVAQDLGGAAAGLEQFIYGKTASMVRADVLVIAWTSAGVILLSLLLLKEFSLLCFDEAFSAALARPVRALDFLLLLLVTAVTVSGLQAVGLILVIAFMITPAAAARCWTRGYHGMLALSAVFGALGGWWGASLSALLPDLPAGAVIVLLSSALFLLSLLFGTERGVVKVWWRRRVQRRRMGRQHLLRAVFELLETRAVGSGGLPGNVPVRMEEVLAKRSWTAVELRRHIRRARQEDHLESLTAGKLQLSESGFGEAIRHTRNHRLWEHYLIRFADVAAQHVDRDADLVEHVLGPELVRQLERELSANGRLPGLPASPHPPETMVTEAKS